MPSEVRAALRGRYGAATRPTPGQRSLTLSVAVPIHAGNSVSGAVLVSQSTFRVLQALYDVRLRIFAVGVLYVKGTRPLSRRFFRARETAQVSENIEWRGPV